MRSHILFALAASAGLSEGSFLHPSGDSSLPTRLFARQNQPNCIPSNLIQKASGKTGQEPGTEGIKPGQAKSATDDNNFVRFCEGQQITNGAQITTGSCNSIPMGKIPAVSNMISAMITNPQPGKTVPADTTFNVSVQINHLNAGNFVNPTTNYYTAPQDLDNNGDIIGHCHVTVQEIGSLQSTTPPDPSKFAFFKGIDDAGNGKGLLQAVVTDGLPAGVYRVCTMIAAQNHQPVNMPVAQRGAQDDCTKFEVVAQGNKGGANNGANNDANAGNKNKGDMTQNQDQEGFVKGGNGQPIGNGQANNGQANNGQANNGQANNGQANNGQANNGQANNGQANNGQANNGQANTGQANTGQANTGQANTGQAKGNGQTRGNGKANGTGQTKGNTQAQAQGNGQKGQIKGNGQVRGNGTAIANGQRNSAGLTRGRGRARFNTVNTVRARGGEALRVGV